MNKNLYLKENLQNLIINSLNNNDIYFDCDIYNYIIENYKRYINNNVYDEHKILKIQVPEFPVLVEDKLNFNYYTDIYIYLYVKKHKLEAVSRYSKTINNIKNRKKRDEKKTFQTQN